MEQIEEDSDTNPFHPEILLMEDTVVLLLCCLPLLAHFELNRVGVLPSHCTFTQHFGIVETEAWCVTHQRLCVIWHIQPCWLFLSHSCWFDSVSTYHHPHSEPKQHSQFIVCNKQNSPCHFTGSTWQRDCCTFVIVSLQSWTRGVTAKVSSSRLCTAFGQYDMNGILRVSFWWRFSSISLLKWLQSRCTAWLWTSCLEAAVKTHFTHALLSINLVATEHYQCYVWLTHWCFFVTFSVRNLTRSDQVTRSRHIVNLYRSSGKIWLPIICSEESNMSRSKMITKMPCSIIYPQ